MKNTFIKCFCIVLLLIALFTIKHSLAVNEIETNTVTTSHQTALEKASEWDITADDWLRYEELMRGSRGTWSPGADPLLVLGAHARNDVERNRFAELYVKKEFERTTGELAFQNAVTAAWARLHPGQLRINNKPKTDLLTSFLSSKPVRYALVLEPGCSACKSVLKEYISKVLADRDLDSLDIYVKNTNANDKILRNFVTSHEIPIDLIRAKRITINHGAEYESQQAPAIWVQQKGGQWKQLS